MGPSPLAPGHPLWALMSPPLHPWLALLAVLIGAPFVWVFARFLFSTPEEDMVDAAQDIPWLLFKSQGRHVQSRCKSCPRGFEPIGSFNLAGVGSFQLGDKRNR